GKIDVPYSAILNPPVFTMALWANVTGGSGTYRSPLTCRQSQPQAGYMFYAAPNDVWQLRIGKGSTWNVLNAGPVVANTWIHLTATYDGTTARFYTNGSLAATATVAFQPNNAFPLRIGAGATEGAGGYWFPGSVDDVRVYRVALDEPHIWGIFINPPVINSIQMQSDGTMLVVGSAVAAQTCVLLAAASRGPGAPWIPIATNVTDIDGNCQFLDVNAIGFAQRFY